METTADDFFAIFKEGKVSIVHFLKRLHNFALTIGWIAVPIVAPYLWPKYEPKDRRGITRDEHESILAKEKKCGMEIVSGTSLATARRRAMPNFKAEDVDQQTRMISYFQQKIGSLAQFTISQALETVLSHLLTTTGALFPKLSTFTANDRASPVFPPPLPEGKRYRRSFALLPLRISGSLSFAKPRHSRGYVRQTKLDWMHFRRFAIGSSTTKKRR